MTDVSAILVVVLVVVGCSSPTYPTYVEDLKNPVLMWDRSIGLCGRVLAVDGDGTYWVDPGGCENGRPELTSKGRGDPAKVATLSQEFDLMPPDSGPDRVACSGNLDTFSRTTDTSTVASRACASGSGYDDLAGLVDPYLSAAMTFLALP